MDAFSNSKIAYCTFPNEKTKFVLPQSEYYLLMKCWAFWLYCIGKRTIVLNGWDLFWGRGRGRRREGIPGDNEFMF